MKKITFLLLTFTAFQWGNAQDTCATALSVTAGTTTVGTINGTVPTPVCALNGEVPALDGPAGEWYSFTATVDGYVNITTDLPANAGGDTRVHIYTGSCGSLTCYSSNDDVDATNSNFLSDVTFPVNNNTTYFIAWDNRWSSTGFDFVLTETALDCSISSFPYATDLTNPSDFQNCFYTIDANGNSLGWTFNDVNDLDGDGTEDEIVNVFPDEPGIAKDDWVITPAINGVSGNNYAITLTYNAVNVNGTANETFELVILDEPSASAANQTVIGTYSNITQSGTFQGADGTDLLTQAYVSTETYTPTTDGVFYIGVHATTIAANSDVLFISDFSIDETLSLDEFDNNTFKHFYNKDTDVLTMTSSTLAFENVEIYNLLGQQVVNKGLSQTTETVDMASLEDGIYLAKVSIQGRTQTVKILKN